MSIIPFSRLSDSDLKRLSHNLGRTKRLRVRNIACPERRLLAAVNRSLASLGEKVGQLIPAGGERES